jgi:arylsulfatase A-like enzyme
VTKVLRGPVPELESEPTSNGAGRRRRNILFITTDQQRYDSLGCNGGTVARTPVVDRLAAEGINYRRAYNQNTVCMPARSTMLTGQYVRTHGVVANGIPLPTDAPSIAQYLHDKAGYRTALLGKAHFEPNFDPHRQFEENARVARGDTGPWRGFERSEQALHAAAFRGHPIAHYGRWLKANHPEHLESFAGLLDGTPGGDTGAPETKNNPIPREWYHTDWVADLTVDWLRSLGADELWFCWMSFPDPHHPWDPPASELPRVPWQDLDLPPGHPGSDEEIRKVLARKPAHWLAYWDGTFSNMEGGPASFVPSKLSDNQIREVNAKVHVMNELIDEACGRVLQTVAEQGWLDNTDVVFTTDHGELQGDFGLLFKGPYHTDALMRLPFVWRPAPSAGVAPAVVHDPVGQVDLAPTFCAIAGIDPAPFMQGRALPTADGEPGRERALCEWDSQFPGYGMHLRSVYRDGWLCTVYEPSTAGQPNGLEETWGDSVLRPCPVVYEQTETGPGGIGISTGELYNVDEDPYQFDNLWDSAAHRARRDDLIADLYASLPEEVRHLKVIAPA